MARPNISEIRALPDFRQMTKWDLTFVTLPAVGLLGFPVSDAISILCESIESPKATQQKIEVMLRGHKVFLPGILDYGNSITLTFAETVDNRIFNFIKAWRELTWASGTGRQFTKKDVEGTAILSLLDNQDNITAKWTLKGLFYESDDFGTFDGASSDIVRPTLTLSFDHYVDGATI